MKVDIETVKYMLDTSGIDAYSGLSEWCAKENQFELFKVLYEEDMVEFYSGMDNCVKTGNIEFVKYCYNRRLLTNLSLKIAIKFNQVDIFKFLFTECSFSNVSYSDLVEFSFACGREEFKVIMDEVIKEVGDE